MEKSINYTMGLKDYLKYLISRGFNCKFFFLYFALTFGLNIKVVIKDFSVSYLASYIIIALLEALVLTFVFSLFVVIFGIYAYKTDKVMQKKVTMNFHDDHLEEVTETTTFNLKYTEIRKLKLLKTILIISISPNRAFVIPKDNNYDINEIYAELKKLKENKQTDI